MFHPWRNPLWCLLLLLFSEHVVVNAIGELSWTNCEIFLAPSSVPGGGWGVFAGRDFKKGEIVEASPLFLPFAHDDPSILFSVVDDYIYGYLHYNETTQGYDNLVAVIYGMAMFYNHHPEPNLHWDSFGHQPSLQSPLTSHSMQACGFSAKRDIGHGEELFSTYGREDGGKQWFQDRRLTMKVPSVEESTKRGDTLLYDQKQYCSKIYAGYGQTTWREAVRDNRMAPQRLSPVDHPTAVTSQPVKTNDILEIAPALAFSKDQVVDTSMATTAILWEDWWPHQKLALRELRKSGDLRVQFQDPSTGWERIDDFSDFSNVALVPVAGSIGLVRKVGKSGGGGADANCQLRLVSTGSMASHESHGGGGGSAGILLQLVATQEMPEGTELRLNLPDSSTVEEKQMFLEALEMTGQPIPRHIEEAVYFGQFNMQEDDGQQDDDYDEEYDYEEEEDNEMHEEGHHEL